TGKSHHGIVQRLARAGVDGERVFAQPLLLQDGLGQRGSLLKVIAPSARRDIRARRARQLARAKRIFVGIGCIPPWKRLACFSPFEPDCAPVAAAQARWASVTMGTTAAAEANRRKERRETEEEQSAGIRNP